MPTTWYWKIVWAPGSERGADLSHTPCFLCRLLSCLSLCSHLLQALYCKIMQYICKNIHSPVGLKTLPCQWAAIACSLQMDSASEISHLSIYSFHSFFFFFLIWSFSSRSGGDAEYESITSSTQQLVWKWAILFCSENNSTFSWKRKKKNRVSLIVSGEYIIRERKPCYWLHYHIHNRACGGKAMLIKAVQEACS